MASIYLLLSLLIPARMNAPRTEIAGYMIGTSQRQGSRQTEASTGTFSCPSARKLPCLCGVDLE